MCILSGYEQVLKLSCGKTEIYQFAPVSCFALQPTALIVSMYFPFEIRNLCV